MKRRGVPAVFNFIFLRKELSLEREPRLIYMPVSESERIALLDKANRLPLCAGVYIMKDRSEKVIYVGKSKHLKNRVSQYFQNSAKDAKTSKMVRSVHNFDYILCDTEIEALVLENTLIKRYLPKYNILLKDSKTYPYLKITDEEYPKVLFTRTRKEDKAKYFGPFSGAGYALTLLELARKQFGIPSCKRDFPRDIGKNRPCIYYQMNQCCGLCTGKISAEEYRTIIKCASDVFKGKNKDAKEYIKKQMEEFAENEQYEAAARYRDMYFALEKLGEKQKIVSSPNTEQDVFAVYEDDICISLSVFNIRDGVLVDVMNFVFDGDKIFEGDTLGAFIRDFYSNREYIPPTVLLSFKLDDDERSAISQYLESISKHKVSVKTPERGDLKALCNMALKNATEKAASYKNENQEKDEILYSIAKLLRLESIPERIEVYDISNIGSEHKTAGMIVCENGKLKRSDYRSFKIKTVEGIDDYAAMREALERRIKHLSDTKGSFSEYPDLILLDGGKGHVSVVKNMFSDMGIEIPVFGMVKDEYHKTRTLCNESEEISIANERKIFAFIYKLQEEVHRFTVGNTMAAKNRTLKHSSLEAIDGIGPTKARILLKEMGSLAAIRAASVDELANIKGISKNDAQNIVAYFTSKK